MNVSWEEVARNLAYKLGAAQLEQAIAEETGKALQKDNTELRAVLAGIDGAVVGREESPDVEPASPSGAATDR